MAAVVAEPWAVASHRTAAVLHELDGFRRVDRRSRPAGANAGADWRSSHRGVDVPTSRVGSFRVTTIAHTFIDLCADRVGATAPGRARRAPSADRQRSLDDGARSIQRARAARRSEPAGPQAVLLRYGTDAPCSESELEWRLQDALDDPRIPEVQWQAPFPGQELGKQRVDGLIPEWSIVVEGDGRAWHTRVEDFERDRRRDAEAAAHGLLTLRFTWNQVSSNPGWVRRMVITAGERRLPIAR